VLLILPAGWVAGGCGSSSSNGTQTPSGTAASGSDLRFTSDIVSGHNHDFSIAMTDLSSPQSAGLSGPTTVSLGHNHTVSLSMDELMQNRVGSDGHEGYLDRGFQFSLAAAASTGAGTASTGAGGSGAGGTTGTGGGTTGPGPGTYP
jgi:hypothetical protein